jgi:hypothetical protein
MGVLLLSYVHLLYYVRIAFVNLDTGLLARTVAQWLKFCATNRKVAGSIPDGVIGFFR